MAPASRPQRNAGIPATFAVSACAGVCGFVAVALFAASGQAHLFAVGAVVTGVGCGLLVVAARALSRVRWRDLVAVAVIVELVGSILGRP